jgi:hypothetical protein
MNQSIIPNLSVDCVIFGFDSIHLNVLLVERTLTSEPDNSIIFTDFTLTGNHVRTGEDPDAAAIRIVNDLTGLHDIYLEQFHTFGSVNRLMNKKDQDWIHSLDLEIQDHVVTVGYLSLIDCAAVEIAGQQSRNVRWFPVGRLPELGFDHALILQKALEKLRVKIRQEPVAFELLAEKFTLTQLQRLYEAILGTRFDPRNFRKKISQMKYVIPLDEKQTGVRHKPANMYIFSRDVYDRTRKEHYGFFI